MISHDELLKIEKLTEEEKRYKSALFNFNQISNEFSNKLKALFIEYNVQTYYNTYDEDTVIKFDGVELNILLSELI